MASSIRVLRLILGLVLAASAASAQTASSAAAPASSEPFEAIAAQAKAAREAGRLEQATALYRRAVAVRRDWKEGWWYLGTLEYERGRGAEAREAFYRFVELEPDSGPGYTLRGLSTALTDPVAALEDLQKGLDLGLGGNAELTRAGRHQQALGLLKSGQFESAVAPLTLLARTSPEAPWLVGAIGLLVLRTPALPSEVPAERRELLMAAGRAGYLHLSQRAEQAAKAYEALVTGHPNEPWVHYAYGVFLLRSDSDRALAELQREVEIKPDNVMAHLEIAFERIVRGEYEQARPAAERAASLAPGLFAARNALGRVLVELGDVERGTLELEEAVRLAPEVPELHFALARAYGKAGRGEDAARERAIFGDLDQKRRAKQAAEAAAPREEGRP